MILELLRLEIKFDFLFWSFFVAYYWLNFPKKQEAVIQAETYNTSFP